MSKPMMVILPVLVLAGCGAPPEQERQTEDAAAFDAASEPPVAMRAPGISVTAAPGVAFNYRYAFKLPADRIAAAQEAHARACEQLGVARCRIVGMRYDLHGENRVEAMLAFKLDPTLARRFGQEGIAAIEKVDGTLVSAEITGTDAGAAIEQATGERGRAQEELERIDRELARPGLRATERSELQRQRAEIESRIQAAGAAAASEREKLANTPMTFDYGSGPAIRGFDPGAPFKSALDTLVASAEITLAVLLGLVAVLGPPVLVLGLLWLAVRRLIRRSPRPVAPPNTAE